MADDDGL